MSSTFGSGVKVEPSVSGNGEPQHTIDNLRVVNGFSAAAGIGLTFQDTETPTGTINGTNRTFALAATPVPNTAAGVHVYSDGVRVGTGEYTVSGTALVFGAGSVNIPTEELVVDYRS